MKHLIIRNVGPLKEADINLKRINVIIGPQGSGKSCVLKIACYCTWVEKRIELSQSASAFEEEGEFVSQLERFHKLDGFVNDHSFIAYESNLMRFQYDGATHKFDFSWKEERWEYKRTKICYIPAERNMVAVIPNWFQVNLKDNNIRNFMADWEDARKSVGDLPVLNLGLKYHYDSARNRDEVILDNSVTVEFTNAASGLQSVIPVCVLLHYFLTGLYAKGRVESVETEAENLEILKHIYNEIYKATAQRNESTYMIDGNHIKATTQITLARIGKWGLEFNYPNDAKECRRYYTNYTETDHCEIFLEEPELSLFPITQHDLLNWLIEGTNAERKHSLFIATHSPYIMSSINNLLEAWNEIEDNEDKREAVLNIVQKNRILSYKEVGAFTISADGVTGSMMDEDSRLISAKEIDRASDIISQEFGKLLDCYESKE